ncbi:unnamed protein product [Trifolium pratense]|uniref:Uncharacterized protein n=1 Tax=Trifolium pratense TaxID=57577 RepID=A0ACB0M0Z8_TRIPR|nr:unnamed protein product [Trifolium pratense]
MHFIHYIDRLNHILFVKCKERKNMVKTLKFVCTMILLFSLFLVAMAQKSTINCESDKDCPQLAIHPKYVCYHGKCWRLSVGPPRVD